MKVALVHELLTTRGGAERVLKVLTDMFPEAPIYTLLYNEKKMSDVFPRERIRTSIAQRHVVPCPMSNVRFNHHLYLKHFPKAVEAWDFSEFDLVISSSSAFAHGIITNGRPKHLCYVHSPARYLWDSTHDVLDRAGKGPLGFLKKRYLEKRFHDLRIWDSEAAERPDMLLANSEAVRRRIELYWRCESDVLHPPVDDFWFQQPAKDSYKLQATSYNLVVSTLSPYKRIDLAIEACNARKEKLLIVGEGRDRGRLERMAGPTIEFLEHRPNDDVRDLYRGATAVIFPGEDDFGLVPVEAQACGTPVIAYGAGGALETLMNGVTGTFFNTPTTDALLDAMDRLASMPRDSDACRQNACRFSGKIFRDGMTRSIEQLMC